MHNSRPSSPGKSRSVHDMFWSFSSSLPRSPSPTKQDLYEMLQQHRMHSFSKRMRIYMQDIGASPEAEVPSFMRQTCASLTKRNTTKSRSRTMSPLTKGSWDSTHVYSGGRYKRLPKSMTGKFSDGFTVDEDPQSGAESSVSRFDTMSGYPVELGYSTSTCCDIYEEKKDPRNEHNISLKDKGLLNSQGGDVSVDTARTRESPVPSLNGSSCSENGEEGTSLNAVRRIDNEGRVEEASSKNTVSSEIVNQSEQHTTNNLTTFQIHTRIHSESQSQSREETHEGVLLSTGPYEQDILFGNRSDELHEAMMPESSLLSETSSSSLHLYTIFCEADPRSAHSMKRGSFNELHQESPQRLNEGDDEGDRSPGGVDSTRQSDARQQLANGSKAVQDQEMRSGESEKLSVENTSLRTDSNSGDIVFAERYCLEGRIRQTQEILDSRCTSSQSFHSASSFRSTADNEEALEDDFNVALLETEVEEYSTNDKTPDPEPKDLPEGKQTILVTVGAPTNADHSKQDSIVFASISSETFDETVNTITPVISTLVYEGVEISDTEDDFSDTDSMLFVQSTNPRSLPGLASNADDPAQLRDDQASNVLPARPSDLAKRQEFCARPDPVHQEESSFGEVHTSERSGTFADYASPFVPRDHHQELVSNEEGNGEAIEDKTGACRRRSTSLNGLQNEDVINSSQAEQHTEEEIEPADAADVLESIELGSELASSSSCAPEEAIVHSSVPKGVQGAHSTRLPKLFQTVSTRSEQNPRRRRRFRFSMKCCFGCRAAPSALGEPESASETREKHGMRRRNKAAPSN